MGAAIAVADLPPTSAPPAPVGAAGEVTGKAWVVLAVENMHCGGCMRKVERTLDAMPGVHRARANLSQKRVSIAFAPAQLDVNGLIARLADSGFTAAELAEADTTAKDAGARDLMRRLAVAGFATANIMLLSVSVWAGLASDMGHELTLLFHWLSALIALPAVAYAGQPFFRSAASALAARRLNMDVPISLGVLLATGMSLVQTIRGAEHVFFDASISLVFFLLIGRYLDSAMRSQATSAAQNLLGLKAGMASVVQPDGGVERIAARLIQPGMTIRVAAGERIAVDGRITQGASDIDEQLITGETVPRSAEAGDQVYAGTIALTAPIEVVATTSDDDSLLAEIARLMEAAEQGRSRYVRLADRAASAYAPAVHTLGLATFIGWMLAGAGIEFALLTAIAVLIITCPCALALAVPAVQVAAVGRLFERGVILTAPDGLERLAEIDTVVLDKTGTLTRGVPRLIEKAAISDALLQQAAALAVNSRHPYARAVVAEARARGVPIVAADGVREVPGAGLERVFGEDGDTVRLGSAEWCGAVPDGAMRDVGASLWFRPSRAAAAVPLRLEDEVRGDAGEIAALLGHAGIGVELLSGDRPAAVAEAAAAAGIERWHGGQRPDQKIAHLERLKAEGRRVLMVGDGLNDAPALAAAHASLSMSNAVAVSQLASDGIVQGERLAPIIEAIAVARRARRMALQNFAIALGYNIVFVPIAMAGLVTPLIAAIAMSASSIVVTANAVRLGRARVRL